MGTTSEKSGGEWLGVVFAVPMYVTEDGEPYRPEAVMFFDAHEGAVVGYELVKPVEARTEIAKLFEQATQAPLTGAPRRPATLRVPTEEIAAALRGKIGEIAITVAPVPELQEVIAALLEHMNTDEVEDEPPTFLQPGVSAEDVGAFFAAAARLYEAQPWDTTPVGGFIGVANDVLEIEKGAMFVVGQDGPPRGFSLFWTEADVVTYASLIDADEAGESIVGHMPMHLVFDFRPMSDVAPALLEEIKTHGWPVPGEDGFPFASIVDADLVGRPLTRDELRGVTLLFDALVQLGGDPGIVGAWAGAGEVTAHATSDGGTCELVAPQQDRVDEVAATGPQQRRANALLEALESEGVEPDRLAWATLLTEYALREQDVLVQDLSSEDLEELMLVTVPADVTAAPEQAAAAVSALQTLLEHVAKSPEPARAAELLQALPADLATQLEARLGDPTAFGPEKTLIMAGTWAGYDMSTEDGVAEFLAAQQIMGEAAREQAAQARAKAKGKPRKN